ncbi:hypothetical protein ACWT_4992 [Actinoplanes sp. SE50]|uniref:DUF2252 domain-containing protein n=1 Tax=unclassified Actinoplanes TaxID=2626549 RepID=UPI00023ECB7D|nr:MULTISPECIES: DUF2252 domain-containing protein [unclassified Actinoplanes]AEV86009.1 hypothetical protein ACPL_5122 [Actinoplanes sp. SE50/110]ATO84407.1 hypothetical protein ACWT_4992 [Actinoplanes sp. SE50]SLM01817.1 hypothetical protein ACSP50_5055 [Actinoplanes sp. SE50/110]
MDATPTIGSPVVPGSAGDEGFTSLRRPARPRAERYEMGRALRERSPRSDVAQWRPPADRPDPVGQVRASHEGRLPWLVPVRIGRMIASPYAFLRGTAGLMADDFAGLPHTGITPVICGDAHLGNFGFYASPERDLVFDLNDFDEAHPGPWEWDLRRLVVSVHVAGRVNGFRESACAEAVQHCVEEYRGQIADLAARPLLARSFDRLNVDAMRSVATRGSFRDEIERAARRARRRTSDRALPRFTERRDGSRRLVEEPPVITRPSDADRDLLDEALDGYLNTLKPHWARILGGYRVIDVAHKVVGVGSVGLRAYVALCEGSDPEDVVFLQLKQARRSVIAKHQHGALAWHRHQGQRVVEYQQALQTVSDPLLGWTTVGEHQYYVRQFRDMKGAIVVEDINAGALADYAGICGYLLAKSHARTSGASMIAGYCGGSDKLDESLAKFARSYADQVEKDHQALVAAVRRGELAAEVA